MHADTDIATGEMTVGMAGTFDVENFGDLLFPLLAAAALQRRDRRIRVVPFSVTGKSEPAWPFEVRPLDELPTSLPTLSAMLIGGGQIVRFDGSYPIAVPATVDMPFAYWLTPAVLAALAGKPVIWNAVGATTGWLHAPRRGEVVRQVFAASYFIGVRDVLSRDHLGKLAPEAAIELLPDTVFGLSRLWPLETESTDFTSWRTSLGLQGDYVVIQANAAVGKYRAIIDGLMASLGAIDAVILPICWCHGDRAEDFPALKGRVFLSRTWLAPKLISEIIGRSAFVVSSSLHACIAALSYGVPGARVPIDWGRTKYDLLDEFEGIVDIDDAAALSRLVARGRRIEKRVTDHADRLERYWDKVADVVRHAPLEHGERSRSVMLRWVGTVCGDRGRLGLVQRLVATVRQSLARSIPNKRITLRHGLALAKTFRPTARVATPPAAAAQAAAEAPRVLTNGAAHPEPVRDRVLDLQRIAEQRMQTEPYQWVFIDRLFSPENAALLAATFPRDKFRKVAGYDGEKGYEYMSRSLIHMGATVPSHPEGLSPAWQALARDLLSPEYRAALKQITGRDLSATLLEVNVIHYGPGAFLGPHVDLREKLMTHVLYFNDAWDPRRGGCLNVLRSADPSDVVAEIPPIVGNSVLVVRSKQSWHSVSRVAPDCLMSRRSLNVIFHLPGSVSSMWPPGKKPALQDYAPAN